MTYGGSSDPKDTPLFFDLNPAPFDYGRLDIDYPPWKIDLHPKEYTWLHFMSREEIFPVLLGGVQDGDSKLFEYMMHAWQDSYVHYDRFGKNYWGHVVRGTAPDNPRDPWNVEHNCYDRADLTTLIWEDMYIKSNMVDAIVEGWLPDDYVPLTPWMSMSEEIINY